MTHEMHDDKKSDLPQGRSKCDRLKGEFLGCERQLVVQYQECTFDRGEFLSSRCAVPSHSVRAREGKVLFESLSFVRPVKEMWLQLQRRSVSQ